MRKWCNRCLDNFGQYPGAWRGDGVWRQHNDEDHVSSEFFEWIKASEVRSGDLMWVNYRNTRQYLRIISARPKANKPGFVSMTDSAHRGYSIPEDRLCNVRRTTDKLKEQ